MLQPLAVHDFPAQDSCEAGDMHLIGPTIFDGALVEQQKEGACIHNVKRAIGNEVLARRRVLVTLVGNGG